MGRILNYFLNTPPKQQWDRLISTLKGKTGLSTSLLDVARSRPRFEKFKVSLHGNEIEVVDSASFVFMYKEIFEDEIYKFTSDIKEPYIIDCGANIGLSILFFKDLYPEAKIIAFEPDPKIYRTLEKNICSFGYDDVELKNYALWDEEGEVSFVSDGSDGGHIGDTGALCNVKTVKLSDFLNKKVEMLKIDIEGAEYRVLQEASSKLRFVENLFVEFHSSHGSPQYLAEILAIIKNAGFRVYITQEGRTATQPFIRRPLSSGIDNQLNIFAYRI